MSLERVVEKTKAFHITSWANKYFAIISPLIAKQNSRHKSAPNSSAQSKEPHLSDKKSPQVLTMVVVAGIPAIGFWVLVTYLPGILVFLLYLITLWLCLGCPVTRKTYKRYLQAANREDFEACSLYSEQFGNTGGDLSNVGKQLVLVNYRQYASVIIFFVLLGLPGLVFYSLCKEWYLLQINKHSKLVSETYQDEVNETSEVVRKDDEFTGAEETVMFVLDWLPSRITAFGFLLVGHFSRALPIWLDTVLNVRINAYDVLAKVAKASEEPLAAENIELQEPLQMVRLVKRNIIFLLMVISVMTMVGVVG
jgi:AmpE protein